ncbi:unnamed protein product [Durusdinium trenchii]|uniref:DNA-directed DNA polymerase n=1 Tax=Durusdinium trenchii TaxID=1381693 RepID=A0ABP0LKN7_9DINO
MSREVAGEEEGVTLLEAIRDGRVPTPEEMTFPQWQAWRRAAGRRPTRRRDGRGLPTGEEVALWRSVMDELYGEGRAAELDEGDEEEEEERPSASASPSVASREVALVNSPRPSSVGTGGVSVVSLRAKLQALYDPSAEEFGAYLMRMGRIISALQALDAAVPPGPLETVTRKAEFMIELYGEHGGLDKVRAVRFLRDKFVAYAQDETLDPRERDSSIAAIGELIEQLGGKPSSSPGKVYSTPSGAEEATVPVARGPVSGLRDVGRGQRPAPGPAPSLGPEQDGDFSLRAKLAALEMELEAMKREKAESEAGSALGSEQGLAAALAQQKAALEAQTKVLQEALGRGGGNQSVTAVKTDLHWPTLTDERSDFKDVTLFYEEFEDVCALANSCRGMNAREKLLALRARCRGSRLKTYQNLYRSAWKSGEVLEDPEAVYERIKSKHLMFSESREEREIRVDAEHVALMKGKLTGHQFEPLFEASVAELEAVGLGKTQRELFLSYLRKVGTSLQREIRSDKRLWGHEDKLRGPQTWEEAHRVVLEYEQREATNKATANAVFTTTGEATRLAADLAKKEKAEKAKRDKANKEANKGKGRGGQGSAPSGWAAPSGNSVLNPFAAFCVVTGGLEQAQPAGADVVFASAPRSSSPGVPQKGPFTELDELPKDWWHVVPNEPGGYQYRTVVQILDKKVDTMLDGCAGSNHITEELVVGIINRAAELGLRPNDKNFPIIQFEKWLYPEYVHGIASGSPVPLKGGFRPGPMTHVLDSLGVHLPRCENFSAERKDRAYPFRSILSAVDQEAEGHLEPETGPRAMVVYAGDEGATLLPGEGALLPVRIAGSWTPEVSSCEVVLPVAGKVEAVPGIWDTGAREGMVLVTPYQEEVVLEEGDPVGELRAGAVVSGTCSCGAVDTVFVSQTAGLEPDTCQECGLEQPSLIGSVCYSCGRKGEIKSTPLQGCKCRAKTPRKARESRKGYGVFATFAVGLAALTAAYAFDPSQYESKSWSRAGASFSSLRREESRARTSFSNPRREEVWATFPGGWVRTHPEAREKLFEFSEEASAPLTLNVDQLDSRRVTTGQFLDGESLFWEDSWREGDPWVFKGRPWVGETRFYAVGHGSEGSWRSTMTEPVFHIVEAPGGIDKMAEETPTERYYDALRRSLEKRFPKANQFLLDHLISLEAFLDKSIVFGFSYGVAKAEICKEGGKLLGHIVGRNGSEPDPERAKAVMDFAPLREKLHIQQFLGCSDWLRMYLPAEYGVCSKILTGYQRPDATFPPEGLGYGSTEGCKAVRAIKRMLAKSISLAMIDEASAISGACPLEQVADASGFAVGGLLTGVTTAQSQEHEDKTLPLPEVDGQPRRTLTGSIRGYVTLAKCLILSRMEPFIAMAVHAAFLWVLRTGASATIFTDSQYALDNLRSLATSLVTVKQIDSGRITLQKISSHLKEEDCVSPREDWSRLGNDFVDMIAMGQVAESATSYGVLQIYNTFCSAEESARNATRSQLSFLVELAQTSLTLTSESHDPEGETLNELGVHFQATDASLAAQFGPEVLSHSIRLGKFSARMVGDLASWLIAIDLTSPSKCHVSLLELVIGFSLDGYRMPLTEHQAGDLFLDSAEVPCGGLVRPTLATELAIFCDLFRLVQTHFQLSLDTGLKARPHLRVFGRMPSVCLGWGGDLATRVSDELLRFTSSWPIRYARDLARPR